ncbi:VOC family protein [Methylocystis bryophila]|uniref:Bleomycin resistance protein n=1 Tax=Methylocystis bryophila TaxID=655015 RepID=A0A1W6MQH2_9HYPH|nr:VOC family protein [Methylocystis bryophila]ARN79838.1 bleomycin resistance protein [Methylocystis bryophila]BDV39725.1 chaP protein [Methylocystis bryophila]
MTIVLNHTIVPAHNKREAARWFAQTIGLPAQESNGHFAPVRVNDTLTLLFADEASFDQRHYAFHVSDAEFDSILDRVKAKKLPFGSAPWSSDDGRLNDWNGGRGVYFRTPDGHLLELMTAPQ